MVHKILNMMVLPVAFLKRGPFASVLAPHFAYQGVWSLQLQDKLYAPLERAMHGAVG